LHTRATARFAAVAPHAACELRYRWRNGCLFALHGAIRVRAASSLAAAHTPRLNHTGAHLSACHVTLHAGLYISHGQVVGHGHHAEFTA